MVANTIKVTLRAAREGRIGCNTVEYIRAFLFSDWLNLLWHGTKCDIGVEYYDFKKQNIKSCDGLSLFVAARPCAQYENN